MNISRGPPGRMGRTAAHLRVDCTGPGLSAFGATAAGQRLDPLYLFARLLIDGCVAEIDVPVQARVGVILFLSGWVRVGCARLLCGHEALLRGPGPEELLTSCGAIYVLDNLPKIQDNTANVKVCPEKRSLNGGTPRAVKHSRGATGRKRANRPPLDKSWQAQSH